MFKDFFDLIFEYIKKGYIKLKNANAYVKIGLFLFVSAFAVFFAFYGSGIRIAYRVNYNGQNVATIDKRSDFNGAVKIVSKNVSGKNVEDAVYKPKFTVTVVKKDRLTSADTLAEAILQNTEEIVEGYTVMSNGKSKVYISERFGDVVEKYLKSFDVKGQESISTFVDDVNIKSGYFLLSDVKNAKSIDTFLQTLTVKTVANVNSDVAVPYETVTEKSGEMVIGTSKIKVEGVEGLKNITEKVSFINGEVCSRETLKENIIREPVTEVIVVGTARTVSSAEEKAKARKQGFSVPVSSGSYRIGDSFGSGRRHKGVDLLAPHGTPIYASKGGTVIRAGWYAGYGNCVEIDHGNGIVTRYGHASKICVSVGTKVSAGDLIALVGSTGNSTGNHVHFEILVGGKQVDPLPYIGLS